MAGENPPRHYRRPRKRRRDSPIRSRVGSRPWVGHGLFVQIIVASCSASVAPVLGPDQIGQVSWRQAASQNIHS